MTAHSQSRPSNALPGVLMTLLFVALTLPGILAGRGGTNEFADERDFHLPAVMKFAADWPHPDLVHYELAMTPGYHLGMALLWRAAGSVLLLRLVNGALAAALVAALWIVLRRIAREKSAWTASLLALPFMFNPYVLGGAISLTTDDAAMLGVVIVVGAAAAWPMTMMRAIALGLVATLTVFTRQIHVWLGGVILFAAFLESPAAEHVPGRLGALWRDELAPKPGGPHRPSWRPLVGGLVALALPVVVVVVFAVMWGGLVPVSEWSQKFHSKGANPATPAFCLALIGAVGPCFLMFHVEHVRALCARSASAPARRSLQQLLVAGGLGLLAALVVKTSAQLPTDIGPPPDGRGNGWLWRLAHLIAERAVPNVADRSILITLLAPIGAVVLMLLWRTAADAGRRRTATILVVALLGWLAAQTMNFQVWQRYFEPMVLVLLAMLTAAGVRADAQHAATTADSRWKLPHWLPFSGIAFLAMGEFALSAITLFKEILNSGAK